MITRHGGIKVNKNERQTLVSECRTSGLTAKEWCQTKGINYRQYVAWATKLNREEHSEEPQQWAEVKLAKEENNTEEIRLNCGKWTICVGSGFNATLLGDVLRVVAATC
jgi:hypothetical protein